MKKFFEFIKYQILIFKSIILPIVFVILYLIFLNIFVIEKWNWNEITSYIHNKKILEKEIKNNINNTNKNIDEKILNELNNEKYIDWLINDLSFEKNNKNIDLKFKDKKINNVFLEIEKIGVLEKMYIYKLWELDESIKEDKSSPDIEFLDLYNYSSWFTIWWHSSWYYWDNWKDKEIFKHLDQLEKDDKVNLYINNEKIEFVVIDKDIKKNFKMSILDTFTIHTCYPVWTTDKRLIVFLKKI